MEGDPMAIDSVMPGQGESEATRSADDAETEDEAGDDIQGHRPGPALQQQEPSRSRASSPASARSDSAAAAAAAAGDEGYARLTARQRARMEKEAGIAEDVAWHEMELLPNLTYTWKGKGIKESGQMTEEEWLKRQEALERRRMRSIRDKREAEEAVKAKIRRAVTARFRNKMGGDSGMDGQGGAGGDQEGRYVRPGWVKMRYTADGVTVAWHPAVHQLSLPVAVAAAPSGPLEPVDLPLQPPRPGEPWQAPPHSSSGGSFKAGCVLTLQPGISTTHTQQQLAAGSTPQQQAWLHCVDSQGWFVGSLLQQEVLQALEFAGHLQPQHLQPQQQQAQAAHIQPQATPGTAGAMAAASSMQHIDWQQWRAVVRSIKYSPEQQLAAVVVRLLQQHVR